MSVTRLFAAALICAATATPVSADVTLQFKGHGQVLGGETGDTTEYGKGLKWRTDSNANGNSVTTIIDQSKGQMIMLWHFSKTATVYQPKKLSQLFSKDNVPPRPDPWRRLRDGDDDQLQGQRPWISADGRWNLRNGGRLRLDGADT